MIFIVEKDGTQERIEAMSFIHAENIVKNPAIQAGETVIDVKYGDQSGTSVIVTEQNGQIITRRIYLSSKS